MCHVRTHAACCSCVPAGDRDWFYCYVFIGLCAAPCTLGFTRAFSFFVFSSRAGSRLHQRMLSGVLQAPMAFFCANPSGRILNKFSSDQGQIDEMLPVMLFDFMQSMTRCRRLCVRGAATHLLSSSHAGD